MLKKDKKKEEKGNVQRKKWCASGREADKHENEEQ